MARKLCALALTLGLLSAPAMAADQFDLICKSPEATERYRGDLAKGEACAYTCERTWKMGDATSTELKIIDRRPEYRGDLEEQSIVNRASGSWSYSMSMDGKPYSRSGSCELAPFSGCPTGKF